METKKLVCIKFSLGSYKSFVDELILLAREKRSSYACVAGVHIMAESYKSAQYAAIINNADIVTPDGQPITWALRWLYGIRQKRVAGMDLLPDLLAAAETQNVSVAFYGGTEEMLSKTREHINTNYPGLRIAKMYSPPFRPLSPEEDLAITEMFNDSGADMIFVVLGCPKQEKWMDQKKNKIHSLMIGIGGALPVLVGMQKRAPSWMQHGGLEWLFRLGQEPKRLYKRYASSNSLFIYLILKEKFAFKRKRKHETVI
jgi:N-acetylglucosaminyldiphosphoundecaprenol N-acetyl-beta-D-mannosaminyltransferase